MTIVICGNSSYSSSDTNRNRTDQLDCAKVHCNSFYFFLFRLILDAYTTADVDYRWKGGDKQSVEIVSKEMAQFDLTDVKTYTKSQTNSKGEF